MKYLILIILLLAACTQVAEEPFDENASVETENDTKKLSPDMEDLSTEVDTENDKFTHEDIVDNCQNLKPYEYCKNNEKKEYNTCEEAGLKECVSCGAYGTNNQIEKFELRNDVNCCSGECINGDWECASDTNCGTGKECNNGKCVDKTMTCTDYNGFECNSDQTCTAGTYDVSGVCCKAACTDIPKTCSEQAGFICQSGYGCDTGTYEATDTNSCCKAACEPTCATQGGQVCSGNTVCSQSTINTVDNVACCLGTCDEETQPNLKLTSAELYKSCWGNDDDRYWLHFYYETTGSIGFDRKVYIDGVEVEPEEDVVFSERIKIVLDEYALNKEIKLVLDPDNLIEETDETDNEATYMFTGNPIDYTPNEVDYWPHPSFQYFRIQGTVDPLGFCVPIYYELYINDTFIEEKLIDTDNSIHELINHRYDYVLGPGTYRVKLVLDSRNNVPETNEDNNVLEGILTLPEGNTNAVDVILD